MKKKSQNNDDSISLNKYISNTGYCSRREADKLIEQGRVTINGNVAVPGNRVSPGDEVTFDGQRIRNKVKPIYIALNKPVGIVSTTDPKEQDNIISFLNHKRRLFPIGRLDKDSQGLIFLTNDGNIVNKILRAENRHEKEYLVTVKEQITPAFIKNMESGVQILGTKTKPCKVRQVSSSTFRIILTQGLNRQIRRMCHKLGYKVTYLKRIRIMNVKLAKMKPGEWRYLEKEEMDGILKLVSGSSKTSSNESSKTTSSKSFKMKSIRSWKTARSGKSRKFKEFRKKGNTRQTRHKQLFHRLPNFRKMLRSIFSRSITYGSYHGCRQAFVR